LPQGDDVSHAPDLLAEVVTERLRRTLGDAGLLADIDGHAESLQGGFAHLDVSGVLALRDLAAVLAVLDRLWEPLGGGEDEPLLRARARLAASVGLRFTGTQRIAAQVMDALKRGLPLNVVDEGLPEFLSASPAELSAGLGACGRARVLSLVGDGPAIRVVLRTP
jgi:hypothetical protein